MRAHGNDYFKDNATTSDDVAAEHLDSLLFLFSAMRMRELKKTWMKKKFEQCDV